MSITLTLRSLLPFRQSNESLMLSYAESGDKVLLTRLYEACGDDLYHFSLTLSDSTLAKDICQKTWLKVMEKKHLYRDSGQFKAWLFTMARNLLIDEYRLNKNTVDEIRELPSNALDVENHNGDIQAQFDRALLSLPFEQREAFCLQQEGFSLQDIGNITHSENETVKSRLRYARLQLRKQLKVSYEECHD